MTKERQQTTGRRKEATARVQLSEGTGQIQVNGKDLNVYFGRPTLRMLVKQPLEAVQLVNKFDIGANVRGGGFSGRFAGNAGA